MPPPSFIGHYRITAKLGEGGMGAVYRATDTKLDREVAIKILPDALAQDPERLARFQREAKVLAALNHPNIAQIYGVEERALVMELVPGATLQGPLPLETALDYARQIAEALEAAHEKGIIHRDLKPANIMVTAAGAIKVLDFGLAKSTEESTSASDSSISPTLTLDMSRAGVILGTAAYMSPEQAHGGVADRRADIWSFGAVLYEMLTGKLAFQGESVAGTLAAVLQMEPDWSVLPAGLPPHLAQLLRRCLTRDRKLRLQAIGEARIVIAAPPPEPAAAVAPPKAHSLPWIAAAAAVAAAAVFAFLYFQQSQPPATAPIRFTLSPDSVRSMTSPSVSPDGRYLAFHAVPQGKDQRRALFLRPLNSLTARQLPGTEGAYLHFWSPDSRSIAFAAGNKLQRLAVEGQSNIETIASLDNRFFAGGTWNSAGDILMGGQSGILRVNAKTGAVASVTTVPAGANVHAGPRFLPDGKHFLFSERAPAGIKVYLRDLDSGKQTYLVDTDEIGAAYVPGRKPGTGFVIFVRESALVGQLLDAGSLQPSGQPIVLAPAEGRWGPISASANGVIVSLNVRPSTPGQVKWLDRKGNQIAAAGEPGVYGEIQLTRDGRHAVLGLTSRQIWILDLERSVTSRLNPATSGMIMDYATAVSPDGRIGFTGVGPGSSNGDIFVKPLNGAGKPDLLFASDRMKHPNDWSYDGRFLIYDDHAGDNRQDLWILPLEGERKPFPFLATPADETLAQFSPDNKWIAYQSDESGRREIYVQGFSPNQATAATGKWQISNAGGIQPRWRRDGKELYYLSLDGKMMVVPLRSSSPFSPGVPAPLFQVALRSTGGFAYDVTADGARFLMDMNEEETNESRILVLLNAQSALREGKR